MINKLSLATGIILAFAFQTMNTLAQPPQKVSYQMVVRDASGELLRESTAGVQISILQGTAEGAAVYVETHTPESNVNGLVNIEVGMGTAGLGTFSSIDWGNGPYFLKVETDPAGGTTYTITGTTEILSVPYALYAKTVETETQTLSDVLAQNNDGNTAQIKNIADPTDDQDAATKAYVDDLLSTIQVVQNGFVDSRDGKHYNTVLIGTQLWMAENLAYLPSVSMPFMGSDTEPYYYVYDFPGTDVSVAKATSNYQTYGVLYNWPAALTACPSSWHLPTDAEWTILTDYLTNNGYGYEGSGSDIAKSMASTSGWNTDSTPGTVGNDQASNNSSGFGALPSGRHNLSGYFLGAGYYSVWWSSTENGSSGAWDRSLGYDGSDVGLGYDGREIGFSVRCVRD